MNKLLKGVVAAAAVGGAAVAYAKMNKNGENINGWKDKVTQFLDSKFPENVQKAIDNKDYNAFSTAIIGTKLEGKVDSREKFDMLLADLEFKKDIKAAIKNNDYQKFMGLMKDKADMMKESGLSLYADTKEKFSKVVEAFNSKKDDDSNSKEGEDDSEEDKSSSGSKSKTQNDNSRGSQSSSTNSTSDEDEDDEENRSEKNSSSKKDMNTSDSSSNRSSFGGSKGSSSQNTPTQSTTTNDSPYPRV